MSAEVGLVNGLPNQGSGGILIASVVSTARTLRDTESSPDIEGLKQPWGLEGRSGPGMPSKRNWCGRKGRHTQSEKQVCEVHSHHSEGSEKVEVWTLIGHLAIGRRVYKSDYSLTVISHIHGLFPFSKCKIVLVTKFS